MNTTPVLVILTGPFACGKTRTAERLVKRHRFIKVLTTTTRPKGKGEINGIHYRFISRKRFRKEKAQGKFVETATTNGHRYGTPKMEVHKLLSAGHDAVICLDIEGVKSFRKLEDEQIKENLITIYIEVSLEEALLRYLTRKRNISPSDLKKRIKTRQNEERWKVICDRRVQNPDGSFNDTMKRIVHIVRTFKRGLLQ